MNEGQETTPLIDKEIHLSGSYKALEDHNSEPSVTSAVSHENKANICSVTIDKQITYTWKDVNVFTKPTGRKCYRRKSSNTGSKHILKNVNGIARPGKLLAILGSSGAGKTTLLNILTFRNTAGLEITGNMAANGVKVHRESLNRLSAYVQQDDLFIGTFTVKEHLRFQAALLMDKHATQQYRLQRVDEVITELGLDKCSSTVIGIPGRLKGISGGEMKRLAFASELLSNPPLMFCDEPTSGLDSYMAQNVVGMLKNLTKKGKTVICTIHQPSSQIYAMFDGICLLAEGRVAFLGDHDGANAFFIEQGMPCPTSYNPADFFIHTLAVVPGNEKMCRETVENISNMFERSEEGQEMIKQIEFLEQNKETIPRLDLLPVNGSSYNSSWWRQFRAVLWRSVMTCLREPMLLKIKFIQSVFIGLLVGIIYFGQEMTQEGIMNLNGCIFIIVTNLSFSNIFGVINTFCLELPVFLREHFNGLYRTDVYFLSKALADLPISFIMTAVFTLIIYYMVGLNPLWDRFLIAFGIFMLIALCACSLGFLISCLSANITIALSVTSPIMIPLMLFGGFFLNTISVPVYFIWLKYLSWFMYGYEALAVNQWEGVDDIICDHANSTCLFNGEQVLAMLNFEKENFILNISCLTALAVGIRLLAFLVLLAKTYKKT